MIKPILTILFLFMIGPPAFKQAPSGLYKNYDDGFEADQRICEISLEPEHKFTFLSKPMVDCVMWEEYHGNWNQKKDTLIFTDSYELVEPAERYQVSYCKEQHYLFMSLTTDKHSTLEHRTIAFEFLYDYDSNLDDTKCYSELDANATVKLPFYDIPHREQLEAIRYGYVMPDGEKRYGWITKYQDTMANGSELPNVITVVLVENPKKERVFRTTKAILKNDAIRIVSKEKTASHLPDNTEAIRFKESYRKTDE